MKTKTYLFALCMAGVFLPVVSLGAETNQMDGDGEGGGTPSGPRMQVFNIPPVVVEVESGVIHVSFTRSLGTVHLKLQDAAGNLLVSQVIDASVQGETSYSLPAGTYNLTITHADETILKQEAIVIPS